MKNRWQFDFKRSRFFLILTALMVLAVFLSDGEDTGNALFWLIIIGFVWLILLSLNHDPVRLSGLSDDNLLKKLSLYVLIAFLLIQFWKVIVFYVIAGRGFPEYNLLHRLMQIKDDGIFNQGFGEEILFRVWLLLPVFKKRIRWFWPANILQAALFAFFHLGSLPYFIFAFGFALISGVMIYRFRTVFPSGMVHSFSLILL